MIKTELDDQVKNTEELQINNSMKLKIEDFDFQISGNFWSLSEMTIEAEKFFILEHGNKNKKEDSEELKIEFWMGVLMIFVVISVFLVLCLCMCKIGKSKDVDHLSEHERSLLSNLERSYD